MINVIYEDNHIIVVEKPVNISSQGDIKGDGLLEEIKNYIKLKYNKPGNVFVGLVHRLDKPVGGVMVFAKTSKAAARLSNQIREKSLKKVYWAILCGKVKNKEGVLKDYLIKDEKNNKSFVVDKNKTGAKLEILTYRVIKSVDNFNLVEIILETGRPHQIRVQMANQGTPVFGDEKYGGNHRDNCGIALWAIELSFAHPVKNEEMVFSSKPKDDYPWGLFL